LKDVKILQWFWGKVNAFQTAPAMKRKIDMQESPLIIYQDCKSGTFPKKALVTAAKNIYAKEKIPAARKTHVIFCTDRGITKLNSMFRGTDRATDVLSFNYDDDDLCGEIYISLDRARVQARRYKVAYDNEIVRLFIHGMFHLLGFDHQTPQGRRKMEARESQHQ
jgi:probable rRNA maturation factor